MSQASPAPFCQAVKFGEEEYVVVLLAVQVALLSQFGCLARCGDRRRIDTLCPLVKQGCKETERQQELRQSQSGDMAYLPQVKVREKCLLTDIADSGEDCCRKGSYEPGFVSPEDVSDARLVQAPGGDLRYQLVACHPHGPGETETPVKIPFKA